MSLTGCPSVEFLDEPTTGVDPVSRRSLFIMLKNLSQSALVLTTHRMDEAEALCDNIAIQVNGRFAAYGSPSQLKDLYGKGYAITVKHTIESAKIHEWANLNMPYLEPVWTIVTAEKDEDKNPISATMFSIPDPKMISKLGLNELFR